MNSVEEEDEHGSADHSTTNDGEILRSIQVTSRSTGQETAKNTNKNEEETSKNGPIPHDNKPRFGDD